MNTPLVSIIIPTYNRADLIDETLDSVLAQTYTNWECIIVDDGSTDNTDEVVNGYVAKDPRFQYHKRPDSHKPGGNGARNYGFEVSKGEFINWFDDDDVMLPEFIMDRLVLFEPHLKFVMGTGYYTNFKFEIQKGIPVTIKNNLFKDYVQWEVQFLTPSVLFRRNYLENKILFLDTLLRGQETEFLSRIFFESKEGEFKIWDKPLFLYRQHEMTKTFQNETYRSDFKSSQLYIAFENLKKSYCLQDKELIRYYRRGIVDVFFRALEQKDHRNLKMILKNAETLWFKKTLVYYQFVGLGNLFIKINRGSYKMETYFKAKAQYE